MVHLTQSWKIGFVLSYYITADEKDTENFSPLLDIGKERIPRLGEHCLCLFQWL